MTPDRTLAEVLVRLNHLPHVEARANQPGAATVVIAAKRNPGDRRAFSASSASASTTLPLLRFVRLASAETRRSVSSERRKLNGADFLVMPTL